MTTEPTNTPTQPQSAPELSPDKFLATIADGLRHAIRDHGPITKELIGSAAKRVWARIKNTKYDPFKPVRPDGGAGEAATRFVEAAFTYLNTISGTDICENRTCIRCRIADAAFEVERKITTPAVAQPTEGAEGEALISMVAAKAAICYMCAKPERYRPAEAIEGSERLFHFQRENSREAEWNAGACLANALNKVPIVFAGPAPATLDTLRILQKIVDRVRLELRDSNVENLSHPAWANLLKEANAALEGRPDFPAPSSLREAAREIVDMIEVEREPHPEWSKNARRKYRDKAVEILSRHVQPREAAGVRCPKCGRRATSDFDPDVGGWYECANCDYQWTLQSTPANQQRVETLHCSCGAACTPEEYEQHVAMGHDAPAPQGVGERCVSCRHELLSATPLDDSGRCVVRTVLPDGDGDECGCHCIFPSAESVQSAGESK